MALYPAFLKLDGLRVVVVGGGPVAASKLDALIAANACVIVIAPEICEEIRSRPDIAHIDSATDDPSRDIRALEIPRGRIVLVERAFSSPDLDGARWAVAAALPHVNQEVAAAATARGLFVNAVDDVSAATAYLGGVVRRGEVEIAISTGGAAPALAGLLREALDALLPADLARWVDIAKQARLDWKRERVPMADRRPRLLRALVAIYENRGTPRVESTTHIADVHVTDDVGGPS
jgi:uroporphyrin-III C-methyltransferase / precorrin-2 dehydrogenase / sirohydrochlorin ferrochelatase